MDIRCVFFDVDGVLTDGNVYVDEYGREIKSFRLTELDALNDIKSICNMIVAITGENTPIIDVFEKRIDWDILVRGCKNKCDEVQRICSEYGLSREEICYIGDGKYDSAAIQYAGLGVCPSNAIQEIKAVADVVLTGKGGENCIYELYQLLKLRVKQKDD